MPKDPPPHPSHLWSPLTHYLTLWPCPLGDHTVIPTKEGSDCMWFLLEGRWGSKVSCQRGVEQRPLLLGTAPSCPLHAFPALPHPTQLHLFSHSVFTEADLYPLPASCHLLSLTAQSAVPLPPWHPQKKLSRGHFCSDSSYRRLIGLTSGWQDGAISLR